MVSVSDPARLEVLKNAIEGIADGMALTLVRTSRSSVVRTGYDFSTGVLNAKGELVGQGLCQPMHLGGMMPALQSCLERYKERVNPGDIFILNDPYEGASHLPDIFLFKPMYVGDALVGYLCAMTHHTDVGGRVAGGNACDSTEIYQEGIRIPALKLYEKGKPNETLFRIIEKAVRVPDKVIGDMLGQVAALHWGEREYLKLMQQYGVEELQRHSAELVDYTERLTRNIIASWPDGSWSFTDYVDDDGFDPGPIVIKATVTKKGEALHVDFTGTSPQCKGAIQPVFATTKAMVYSAVKCIVGPQVPNTAGYFRTVTVTAPEGTFVNPLPPAPVAARTLGCIRLAQAVFGAFAQMVPERVYACSGGCELGISMAGYDRSERPWKPWVQLEFYNEQGVGAFRDRDGYDAQCGSMVNMANVPAEQLEVEQPLRVLEYGFRPDSEGAGKFRGGLGMIRTYQYTMDDSILQIRSDRRKHRPYGLFGGQSPAPTQIQIARADGKAFEAPAKSTVDMNKGDAVRFAWPGAGGWGNALERDPEKVLADVLAEYITPQRARDVYGVAVDVERRSVDWEATRKLRASLGGQRASR